MADKRIHDLDELESPTRQELTSYEFVLDKSGEAESKAIKYFNLTTSDAIPDSSATDDLERGKLVNVQAFKGTTADVDRLGVLKKATSEQITDKTGTDAAIVSANQGDMQAQWEKDFFQKEGIYSTHRQGGYSWSFNNNSYIDELTFGDPPTQISPNVEFDPYNTISYVSIKGVVASTQGAQKVDILLGQGETYFGTGFNFYIHVVDSRVSFSCAGGTITNVRISLSMNRV